MQQDDIAKRIAATLGRPYEPLDTSRLDGGMTRSELALMRIAHAAEYIAGQSYVIRDLLEDSDLDSTLDEMTKAINRVARNTG